MRARVSVSSGATCTNCDERQHTVQPSHGTDASASSCSAASMPASHRKKSPADTVVVWFATCLDTTRDGTPPERRELLLCADATPGPRVPVHCGSCSGDERRLGSGPNDRAGRDDHRGPGHNRSAHNFRTDHADDVGSDDDTGSVNDDRAHHPDNLGARYVE